MPATPASSETIDAVCTLCGCVCDDLRAETDGPRIARIHNACELSEDWFLQQDARPAHETFADGRPVTFDEAIDRAAAILEGARFPLIYGLSRSSTPGQQAAVGLADRAGGVIDTSASTCHAPSILAMQFVGESTCTLGEVRNRADLVIFWGSNPVRSHPRHLERYSADPIGEFLPHGRRDRTLVVIDTERTETADRADLFLQVERESDFEVLWALRALVAGLPVNQDAVGGVAIDQLRELADAMTGCRFGAAFFGLGLAGGRLPHLKVEALLRLVTDLNAQTRFIARRMRNYGDVAGADSVLCWQTGYPFSVSLSRDFPRYNPGEFSAADLLERGEPDACVIVGIDGLAKLSPAAREHLQRIPTVTLLDPLSEPGFTPSVQFTTGIYGIHDRGTAYRMDEVPLPLPQLFAGSVPMDHDVLSAIAARITPCTGRPLPATPVPGRGSE